MTKNERFQRDMDTLKESLRLAWLESAHSDPAKRAEFRHQIALYFDELRELLSRCENESDSK